MERLITTAQQLLWERGYVGTSPKALQRLSGVGQGSMYHHFTGKAELAAAALTRSAEEVQEAAETLLGSRKGPLRRVVDYLLRQRETLKGCPIGRMVFDPDIAEDDGLTAPLADMFEWLTARLTEVVAEAQQVGELNPRLDPAATAAAVAAVVQGGYVLARAAGSVEPFDNAVAGMLGLLDVSPPRKPRR